MIGEVEPVVTVDVQSHCDIRVKLGPTTQESGRVGMGAVVEAHIPSRG